jgi:hypothetical protein
VRWLAIRIDRDDPAGGAHLTLAFLGHRRRLPSRVFFESSGFSAPSHVSCTRLNVQTTRQVTVRLTFHWTSRQCQSLTALYPNANLVRNADL